jgi:hypothetical protein
MLVREVAERVPAILSSLLKPQKVEQHKLAAKVGEPDWLATGPGLDLAQLRRGFVDEPLPEIDRWFGSGLDDWQRLERLDPLRRRLETENPRGAVAQPFCIIMIMRCTSGSSTRSVQISLVHARSAAMLPRPVRSQKTNQTLHMLPE